MEWKRINKVKTLLLVTVAVWLSCISFLSTLDNNVYSISRGEHFKLFSFFLSSIHLFISFQHSPIFLYPAFTYLSLSGIYPVDHSQDSCEATIVTAYFRMVSKHSHDEYLTWMRNMLTLRDCVVVFTQSDLVDTIRSIRPVFYPTRIILTNITQVCIILIYAEFSVIC